MHDGEVPVTKTETISPSLTLVTKLLFVLTVPPPLICQTKVGLLPKPDVIALNSIFSPLQIFVFELAIVTVGEVALVTSTITSSKELKHGVAPSTVNLNLYLPTETGVNVFVPKVPVPPL